MQVIDYDRHVAYIAARSALETIGRATGAWPAEVASEAKRAASEVVTKVTEAFAHDRRSAAHRRCLRSALANALELAAICDVARAHGLGDDESLRCAGRTLSMLGLSYLATSAED